MPDETETEFEVEIKDCKFCNCEKPDVKIIVIFGERIKVCKKCQKEI